MPPSERKKRIQERTKAGKIHERAKVGNIKGPGQILHKKRGWMGVVMGKDV